jgi:hypothetical protein
MTEKTVEEVLKTIQEDLRKSVMENIHERKIDLNAVKERQEKKEILAALKYLLDNHTCSRWDAYVSEERTGCVCAWCEAFRVWNKYEEKK